MNSLCSVHISCRTQARSEAAPMHNTTRRSSLVSAFFCAGMDDWKALVRSQGGDPVSPAFSLLDQRVTLLDGSLFLASAVRNQELMQRFGPTGQSLLDLAVTHEMGHGICQDKDERRADDDGYELRDGKIPDCSKTPGRKQSSLATSIAPPTALNGSLRSGTSEVARMQKIRKLRSDSGV